MGTGADLFTQFAEDAIDFPVIEREGDLEGIAYSELDAIGVAQHVAGYAFAVDPSAMATVEILNHVGAIFRKDARMLARGSVVAENQIVIGLAAEQEGKRLQGDAGALAGGGEDEQGGGGQVGLGGGGHLGCRLFG